MFLSFEYTNDERYGKISEKAWLCWAEYMIEFRWNVTGTLPYSTKSCKRSSYFPKSVTNNLLCFWPVTEKMLKSTVPKLKKAFQPYTNIPFDVSGLFNECFSRNRFILHILDLMKSFSEAHLMPTNASVSNIIQGCVTKVMDKFAKDGSVSELFGPTMH